MDLRGGWPCPAFDGGFEGLGRFCIEGVWGNGIPDSDGGRERSVRVFGAVEMSSWPLTIL